MSTIKRIKKSDYAIVPERHYRVDVFIKTHLEDSSVIYEDHFIAATVEEACLFAKYVCRLSCVEHADVYRHTGNVLITSY